MTISVHASILSWTGYHDKARYIAQSLTDSVEKLTVIYSDKSGEAQSGPGNWIQMDNRYFFGPKFERSLHTQGDEDYLLQIDADVEHEAWDEVVEALRQSARLRQNIGIWVPDIDWTHWSHRKTAICDIPGTTLFHTAQTDCMVWALSKAVIPRMLECDYSVNNFGWGIDTLAVCHAASSGMDVVRDMSVKVRHKKGSGYSHKSARKQMEEFLKQMTDREECFKVLLENHYRMSHPLAWLTR